MARSVVWWYGLILVTAAVILAVNFYSAIGATHPIDLVSILQAKFQVVPGSTKVLPECGCTVRYVGTSVHGRRYMVIIDKLD